MAKVGMAIWDHKEQLPMFVTKLDYYPSDIGTSWIRVHDVAVCFVSNMVTFGSQYSMTDCHDELLTIRGVTEEPPEPVYPVKNDLFESQI